MSRLGYSPEEHARSAALDARSFRVRVRDMKRAIASGDCTSALYFFGLANRYVGAYTVDRIAAMKTARGRVKGGLATGERMSKQIAALEDKLMWCARRKYGKR
jgi:hypothetical protein